MATLSELAPLLVAAAAATSTPGWAPGTAGNFSSRLPERQELEMTPSGVDKGRVTVEQGCVKVDRNSHVVGAGTGEASPEPRPPPRRSCGSKPRAAAVLPRPLGVEHDPVAAPRRAPASLTIQNGHEMLKGLTRETTHEHRGWVPIVANAPEYGGWPRRDGGPGAASAGARAAAAGSRAVYLVTRLEEAERQSRCWSSCSRSRGGSTPPRRHKAREALAVWGGKDVTG